MEALKFDYGSQKLELVKTEIPKITQPNEVLIKIAYAGVCGTDIHILQKEFACYQSGPFSLGHELSGTVAAVGQNVQHVKIGDKVAADPNSGCHTCKFCTNGQPHLCQTGGLDSTLGIFVNGAWAEYCLIPAAQVYKLPEKITLEEGVFCEPLSCIAHGWDLISPVIVGQKILIIGAGIIGKLWSITLHLQGHRQVTVSEPNQARLDSMKKLNTDFNLVTPGQLNQLCHADADYKFGLIIDCSGYAPAIEGAIDMLEKGGMLCIFGVTPPDAIIKVSPYKMFKNELKIIGVVINQFSLCKAIRLIEAMGDRYLNHNILGVQSFHLKDYQQALNELKNGQITKAVFKF